MSFLLRSEGFDPHPMGHPELAGSCEQTQPTEKQFFVKETHLLILKHEVKGQASNLTHI